MAKKNDTERTEIPVQKYKGEQLLRMDKYNNRAARVAIKPDGVYSFEEADKLISDIMKKKG